MPRPALLPLLGILMWSLPTSSAAPAPDCYALADWLQSSLHAPLDVTTLRKTGSQGQPRIYVYTQEFRNTCVTAPARNFGFINILVGPDRAVQRILLSGDAAPLRALTASLNPRHLGAVQRGGLRFTFDAVPGQITLTPAQPLTTVDHR
ncbi:hypothetical protein [Deinococcus soli (ex Cha et al. 2016)]|uniref:Uncharacterized protein n=2 Tax=Deinococcus soli (ex Cha et al. 2016) TaxID=1309411 RepID=A0ACC6KK92_9DEIO|nr:hypothetical protein [Deinococcus soli (ex Cha et al. 2016)]MDR6220313.1 hypothetical protein [Deinococcus soli (ex Cha et al. 2016)]MDR6330168.1 hypothetical protein [Deinococcus soli (ex Cha et al. 2016)]MDR6752879.1 hypothetical protein [Deinococcus soli (ex Cha et al. 2016)]